MKIYVFTLCLSILYSLTAAQAQADRLSAKLENPDEPLVPSVASVSQISLQNDTTSPLFITGASLTLTDNAVGHVYTSAFNQEGLNKLGPGQRWEGPLAQITPRHLGPLLVAGRLTITGGLSSTSAAPLTVLPLALWISDPKRSPDGGFLRGALARCDRPAMQCCEEAEAQCVQRPGHCLYVASGFDQQRVCQDGHAEPVYEHVSDVQQSADGTHLVYRASTQCSTDGTEEHCHRTIVFDQKEQAGPGVPGPVTLSPDGKHYAYRAYRTCVMQLGEEDCRGVAGVIVDGMKVVTAPPWLRPPVTPHREAAPR